jgi:prophage regulatory protein
MDTTTSLESLRFLHWPEVHRLVGLSRATVWRLERAGRFPRRCRLAPGSIGWVAQEVADWIEARRQERPGTR